jgi:hypothetical protein
VRAEAPGAEAKPEWAAALYVDAYLPAGEDLYVMPTLFADRGPLHLEARWNYEDVDTASLFAGWTFGFGTEDTFVKLTPMLGGVFGNVNGAAPGLEVEAAWARLAYWLEAEYVLDFEDSSANFLYTWSELNVYALDWLWLGGSVQRIKPVETETELDVGPMIGVGQPEGDRLGWSLSFYAYGVTKDEPTYLLTGALMF